VTNPNDPVLFERGVYQTTQGILEVRGLTKREYFAAVAMLGILSGRKEVLLAEQAGDLACLYADALIAELSKEAK